VLQCVAVRYSALLCLIMCCRMSQYMAVFCRGLQVFAITGLKSVCSMNASVERCFSALQCVAVRWRAL